MKKAAILLLSIALPSLLAVTACTKTLSGSKTGGGRKAEAAIEPIGQNTVRGTFTAREGRGGAVSIEMIVQGLTPGRHGTHIHSGGSCGDDGKGAGPHWDPHTTGKHGVPQEPATAHHAADMPNIDVDANGKGSMRFQTTNFKLSDLAGKTVVVHANQDNYTDSPANGGSGGRIGCGVIQLAEK